MKKMLGVVLFVFAVALVADFNEYKHSIVVDWIENQIVGLGFASGLGNLLGYLVFASLLIALIIGGFHLVDPPPIPWYRQRE